MGFAPRFPEPQRAWQASIVDGVDDRKPHMAWKKTGVRQTDAKGVDEYLRTVIPGAHAGDRESPAGLLLPGASRHHQCLPSYPARVVRCEKDDRLCDVLRLCDSSQRRGRFHVLTEVAFRDAG